MATSRSSKKSHGNEMKCRVDVDQSRFMEGWATLPRPVADFGRYLTIVWLVEWNQSWFFVMTVRKAASRPAGSKQGFQDTLKVYWSWCLHWNSSKFHFQWSYFSVLDLSIIVCICMHFTSHICCPWITWYRDADESFGFPKPGILGWQEPEKAHLSFTHLGRCAISCDLCQQMHASMPTFCQEKREKEKDAGTMSVLNCPSYGFCCLTWPWAVVQYLSPKVRRKLKNLYFKTLSTCMFSPQIPFWKFSFFMRHDESKWGKKKASASASVIACTPHLHGFSRVHGLQHWRQKIKRQALAKMLVRCKVFEWRLAKVRRPEAYSFAPRTLRWNYSFAVIHWGW